MNKTHLWTLEIELAIGIHRYYVTTPKRNIELACRKARKIARQRSSMADIKRVEYLGTVD